MQRPLQRKKRTTKMCKCSKCGYQIETKRGVPCTEQKCPKCGSIMRGKFCL